MLSMRTINPYVIPGIPDMKLENDNIIYTPSLLVVLIENEFGIPGMLFYKSRSPRYSLSRYLFTYILETKMKLSPDIINAIYGIKHDSCWQARLVVSNILETRTPRHQYIKFIKIIQKIKKWDINEIIQQLESKPVKNAGQQAYRRNTLEQSILVAQYSKQKPVLAATEPEELKLQPE